MKCDDFHILVGDGGDVRATDATQGVKQGILDFSGERKFLGFLLDWLEQGRLKDRQEFAALGEILYNALFGTDVQSHFDQALDRAKKRRPPRKVRVRLEVSDRLEQSGLRPAALPWEFLHRPGNFGYFLATHLDLTLTRFWPPPKKPKSLKAAEAPLRALIVTAHPSDLSPVLVDRGKEFIDEAVVKLRAEKRLIPKSLPQPGPEQLRGALVDHRPHLLHFMGHGRLDDNGKGAELALVNDGKALWRREDELADLFLSWQPNLIVLTACEGAKQSARAFQGLAPRLLRGDIRAIVAMQFEISNKMALDFTREFYKRLAAGLPVDLAVQETRQFLTDQPNGWNSRDFAAPVLFMHSADGIILPDKGVAPSTPPNPPIKARRERPALGGDSISHFQNPSAATLGCLVRSKSKREVYILSDATAFLGPDGHLKVGDAIIQPGLIDEGNTPADVIATVATWLPLGDAPGSAAINLSCALARVRDLATVSAAIRGKGFIKGVRDARIGTRVFSSGRTSGVAVGTVEALDSSVRLQYPSGLVGSGALIGFQGLISCSRMLQPGDSGAVLLDADNYALGLGFAGSETASLFLPMRRVLEALNVELVTEALWHELPAQGW